jgi:hypothetical protein
VRAALTAQGRNWEPEKLKFRSYSIEELENYLETNRDDHAVVVKCGALYAAVWCGVRQSPDNFHWMMAPFEEPNEVFGGELTAEEALQKAMAALTTEVNT